MHKVRCWSYVEGSNVNKTSILIRASPIKFQFKGVVL